MRRKEEQDTATEAEMIDPRTLVVHLPRLPRSYIVTVRIFILSCDDHLHSDPSIGLLQLLSSGSVTSKKFSLRFAFIPNLKI